jgi:anti-anti-sigma factor
VSDLATLRFEHDGDLVFAEVRGQIDPSNARELGLRLTAAVPNAAMAVIIDLAEVEYLDSSGVQLLFELAERLESRQQRLAVTVPEDAPARRVLDIVALDATAPVASSRDEALERLAL